MRYPLPLCYSVCSWEYVELEFLDAGDFSLGQEDDVAR